MNASRARAIGILAVIAVVAALAIYTSWRMESVARQGWAGISYIPADAKRHNAAYEAGRRAGRTVASGTRPGRVTFVPGSIVFLYPGAPAARSEIEWRDRILAINGIPTSDRAGLQRLSTQTHTGDVVTYHVQRDNTERDIRVRFSSPLRTPFFILSFSSTLVVAATFLLIGTFVFWRRPLDARAVVFFVMTLVATVSFINGSLAQVDLSNARGIAGQGSFADVSRLAIVAVISLFFAPLLLHLALIFPAERPVMIQHRRTTLTWIYGYPIFLAVLLVVLFSAFVGTEGLRKGHEPIAFGLAVLGAVSLMAVYSAVVLAIRVPRMGFRKALIQSPIASTALLPVFVTLLLLAGGLICKLTGSMAPLLTAGVLAPILMFGAFMVYPLATLLSLFRSYRDSGVEARRQVKWPVWGTMLAVGGKLVLSVFGIVIGFALSSGLARGIPFAGTLLIVPDFTSKLLYVLIPVAFAIAILKYRLMNIDVIIRRTVLYSILSAVVFLLYAFLVASLGTALVKFAGLQSQTILVASTVVIALVTVPIRNRLQRMVDRNLFRERRDYPLALRNIGNAIATSGDVDTFLHYAAEQIQQGLQSRLVLIAIRRDREYVATAKVGLADEVVGTVRVPVDVAPNVIPELLRKIGAARVIPVKTYRESVALLVVGTKLSDEDFSSDDLEFLNSAASQMAIGIENLRLRDEEVEFEQARAMQQILLPKRFPQLDGFEIAGEWQPARSVGGDYFDTLSLGDSKAGICIGDVAGKGMPAALLMANLQAAVKATAAASVTPAAVCERVKEIVGGNLSGGKFISFFYGVLDARTQTFTYSNAGHNPPILIRSSGDVERLSRGGPAMSRLFKDVRHEQDQAVIASGDRIVLFTDGVSEARRGEEEFGDDRLIELLLRSRQLGAHELQERILHALREFTAGDFNDDVTLVVIAAQ
jgi:serine phosphatase RsbU (regulator of sigma subunit)